MVIVVGIGHGEASRNPGRSCCISYVANNFGKRNESNYSPPPPMSQYLSIQVSLTLVR